jgi:pyrimidine-nucleoside phosphorylase/thymidine phosphorylase
MNAIDVIRAKRDGGTLDEGQIAAFVDGAAAGSWPDYQVAALLMAIAIRGMSDAEASALTEQMAASGRRFARRTPLPRRVDKHSTGGVGDKTSLVLAPAVAACGLHVPMMSGRALGHTGGTLDKLEAIPGFRVELSPAEIDRVLDAAGCCIVGQTPDVAPADRRLYALRDVTGTVESVPLIAASILSKKLVEDLDGLVLDVKCGTGAFMRTPAEAQALARVLAGIGTRCGVPTEAIVTGMDHPLGRTIGNAVEVNEAIQALRGAGPADLHEVVVRLGAEMLVLGGAAASRTVAERRLQDAITSGDALDTFARMVAAQGGDASVVEHPDRIAIAGARTPVPAARAGFLARLEPRALGRAAIALGAGRRVLGDAIDLAAGIRLLRVQGDAVAAGEPVMELHHAAGVPLDEALALAAGAITIAEAPCPAPSLFPQ